MIDIEQIRKLSPANGDIFQLPADTPPEQARALAEAIALANPGVKAMVFCGEICQLDKGQMNAAGWYRA